MRRRQTMHRQWLIIRGPADRQAFAAAKRLPRGCGVLLLQPLAPAAIRQLRQRGVIVVREQRECAVRAHNIRELRRALLARTPLIFLSPIYPTRSHPDWKPIPRMRAAALARLGRRRLLALGGMDPRRYAAIAPLGFAGWAGISAWQSPAKVMR